MIRFGVVLSDGTEYAETCKRGKRPRFWQSYVMRELCPYGTSFLGAKFFSRVED